MAEEKNEMQLLILVLESFNEYNISNLWLSFTKQQFICINIEASTLMFYHLNNKTYLWQRMGPNELSSIIQREFITFLTLNKKSNTDIRLDNAINKSKKVNIFNIVVQQISKMDGIYDIEKTNEFFKNLDSVPEVINFKNGCYNLKTKEFRKRNVNDYYTKCLNYDYTEDINIDITNEILKTLRQICNDDEKMFSFMLSFFGY